MISLRLLSVLTVIVSTLTEFCERRAPNTNNSLSIQDCQTFHQIYLNIGTPSMAYPFLVDTGSLMTWVPTVGCNCGLGIDSMVSATSRITRKSHNITYADGDTIFGFEGTEHFAIPNTNLKGVQTPMVFVTRKQAPKIGNRGILALGYDAENIFDTAYKQGLIATSAFVINFGNTAEKSRILFDKIPSNIIRNSIYAPILTNLHLWAVESKGVRVAGRDFSSFSSDTLLIDSGTTITTLNKQLYTQLSQTIFSSCQHLSFVEEMGMVCPSTLTIPKIQFQVEGGTIYLDPKHYTSKFGDMIQVHLVPSQISILGSSFFKNYAITFDKLNKRIGFYNSVLDKRV